MEPHPSENVGVSLYVAGLETARRCKLPFESRLPGLAFSQKGLNVHIASHQPNP